MTLDDLTRTRGMRWALGALTVAVLVTGWTVVRAVRTEAMPDPPPVVLASLETASHGMARPPADIQAAVDNDVFDADRTAPSAPYRMPGESSPDDAPKVEPVKPVVLGTAVATDGRHFATVQLGDGHPTLVHVGDRIGEWIVRSIERGKVVLVTSGGSRAEVTGPKPGL